jgi:hypothetical protein
MTFISSFMKIRMDTKVNIAILYVTWLRKESKCYHFGGGSAACLFSYCHCSASLSDNMSNEASAGMWACVCLSVQNKFRSSA